MSSPQLSVSPKPITASLICHEGLGDERQIFNPFFLFCFVVLEYAEV